MKKGFILSALTTLSMSFLAGAMAPTPVAHAAGQDIKVWVQFSDETTDVEENILILGHKKEKVLEVLGNDISYVVQEEQLGTGHAVKQAQ